MDTQNIKSRLAEAIQKSNCDIPTLAKQLGISQRRLENYASGKTLPPIVVFANICKILNIDVNRIFLKS